MSIVLSPAIFSQIQLVVELSKVWGLDVWLNYELWLTGVTISDLICFSPSLNFYTCTQFAAYSKALEDAIAALDEVAFEIDVTDRKFHFCSCLCKGYIRTVQPNTLTSPWGLTDWFIWTWLLPDTWVPLYRSDDVEYCAKLHWYKVYKSFWNSYCGKMVVLYDFLPPSFLHHDQLVRE